jgi:AcrR family transcriptional regulator
MKKILINSRKRRQMLVDAAELLFDVIGYENATIPDIMEKANLAPGTFYYYFNTKEALLRAVLNRQISQIRDTVVKIDTLRNSLNSLKPLRPPYPSKPFNPPNPINPSNSSNSLNPSNSSNP